MAAIALSECADCFPRQMSSYSHSLLNTLHEIAGLVSVDNERFPISVLDPLCYAVVRLVPVERGIYSLIMMTIQKQLLTVGPYISIEGLSDMNSNKRSHLRTRQIIAILLAAHLLNEKLIAGEDKSSLVKWVLSLYSIANDEVCYFGNSFYINIHCYMN